MFTPPIRSGEHNVPVETPPLVFGLQHQTASIFAIIKTAAKHRLVASAATTAKFSRHSSVSSAGRDESDALLHRASFPSTTSVTGAGAMQLMTFNSLLMFDIVFVFFLFLVGVTCLVYYLPPSTRRNRSHSGHIVSGAVLGPVHSSSYHELCSAHRALQREHGFAATVVLTASASDADGDRDERVCCVSSDEEEDNTDTGYLGGDLYAIDMPPRQHAVIDDVEAARSAECVPSSALVIQNDRSSERSSGGGMDTVNMDSLSLDQQPTPSQDATMSSCTAPTVEFFTAALPPTFCSGSFENEVTRLSECRSTHSAQCPGRLMPYGGRSVQHHHPVHQQRNEHMQQHHSYVGLSNDRHQCCYVSARDVDIGHSTDPVQDV